MTEGDKEQQRIFIAISMLATIVAAQTILKGSYWSFINGVAALSGICSFLYILLTAASLKYKDPHLIGGFIDNSEKMRKRFFDLSVDIYGNNLIIVFVYFFAYIIPANKPTTGAEISWRYYILGIIAAFLLVAVQIKIKRNANRKKI